MILKVLIDGTFMFPLASTAEACLAMSSDEMNEPEIYFHCTPLTVSW